MCQHTVAGSRHVEQMPGADRSGDRTAGLADVDDAAAGDVPLERALKDLFERRNAAAHPYWRYRPLPTQVGFTRLSSWHGCSTRTEVGKPWTAPSTCWPSPPRRLSPPGASNVGYIRTPRPVRSTSILSEFAAILNERNGFLRRTCAGLRYGSKPSRSAARSRARRLSSAPHRAVHPVSVAQASPPPAPMQAIRIHDQSEQVFLLGHGCSGQAGCALQCSELAGELECQVLRIRTCAPSRSPR